MPGFSLRTQPCCKGSRTCYLVMVMLVLITLLYIGIIHPLVSSMRGISPSIFQLKKDIMKIDDTDSLFKFMEKYEFIRKWIQKGKDGGIASLHDQLLGRVYMVSHKAKSSQPDTKDADPGPDSVSFFGVDVSDALEATYIYRRILQRKTFNVTKLVIDIGANDGLLSSNSFNFIHWGWSAILVEPQKEMLDMARKNTAHFHDPYNDGKQRVEYVQAVIGETDGQVQMAVPNDLVNMENYIISEHRGMKKTVPTVQVPSMTVTTFANNLKVPKRFGILSIDAEGVGDKILHQFIDAGFRPEYVIYEPLHNSEHHLTTMEYMKKSGYKFLTKRGWNQIYEFGQI